jgi:hypothetical protein
MTTRFSLLLMIAIGCTATSVSAQKLYRCNNTYQDHPCSGQEGKVIGNVTSGEPAQASPASTPLSAECSRRGTAAVKIKWTREAGRTQQEQEAAATSSHERDLVVDVYRRQGNSAQVRAAVEADCMAEQERAARTAALVNGGNLPQGGSHSTAAGSDIGNSPGAGAEAARQREIDAANSRKADQKRRDCQNLAGQLDDVRADQRAGGTVRQMERLRQKYQDITASQRQVGC